MKETEKPVSTTLGAFKSVMEERLWDGAGKSRLQGCVSCGACSRGSLSSWRGTSKL
jgi:heterodisulfide reductase subunit C